MITIEKCAISEMPRITDSRGSTRSANDPRTEAGSIGLGWRGGSVTNWNRTVRSPSEILPRACSVSGAS